MLIEYVQAALRHARYEVLPDQKKYYGEIPQCKGVYASARNLEECRKQLAEILEEWVLLRIYRHLRLPVFNGVKLAVKESP
ncbi:MAG: type II toxin-antitoxin system HicB family antitoxin [Candidatus Omnitrophica bacterium]|nr:type II toxin-antitoxin system HicB family antitoxin [Candidatus Omnitrophota bacterium]